MCGCGPLATHVLPFDTLCTPFIFACAGFGVEDRLDWISNYVQGGGGGGGVDQHASLVWVRSGDD